MRAMETHPSKNIWNRYMSQDDQTKAQVSISDIVDRSRIGKAQLGVFLMCAAVIFLDGIDTFSITYVAPVIVRDLGLSKEALGPIFAAHLVGMIVGAVVIGSLADKFGRRSALLWSTLLFGLFTVATMEANGFVSLVSFRIATGIGLGGAIANVIALTVEYTPSRSRATVLSLVYSAYPLGGAAGGLLSIWLLKIATWQYVFGVGGIAPLVLLMFLQAYLPESIRFLAERAVNQEELKKIAARISAVELPVDIEIVGENSDILEVGSWRTLFRRYLFETIFAWVTVFSIQLTLVFVVLWMPTILNAAGLGLDYSIVASSILTLSGIVGSLVISRIIDRMGPYVTLSVSLLTAFALVAAIGSLATSGHLIVFAIMFACGFFLVGVQVNINAVVASLYPTVLRSTGVGFATGVGRAGGIAGAVSGSALLAAQLSLPVMYLVAASPLLATVFGVFVLGGRESRAEAGLAMGLDTGAEIKPAADAGS